MCLIGLSVPIYFTYVLPKMVWQFTKWPVFFFKAKATKIQGMAQKNKQFLELNLAKLILR